MTKALKHIAGIHTGLFATPQNEGKIIYLQVKHFNEDGEAAIMPAPSLKAGPGTGKHLLKAGDVLFSAKGFRNFAAVYHEGLGPAVASSSFFVIRIFDKIIKPEYLAWYINHPKTRNLLQGFAIGSAIQSISKEALGKLEIAIPPIPAQETLLQIDGLLKKEKELRQKITELRKMYMQHLLMKATRTYGR